MKKAINILFCFLSMMILVSCSRGEDAFMRPLDLAVKERKISKQKALQIREEYRKLPDSVQSKYLQAITAILEAGGDSTHVDVVRYRIIRKHSKSI